VRSVALFSLSAIVAGLIVVLGSVGLWLGLPFAWLWVGSQVHAWSESRGTALGAAMLGFIVSLVIALRFLGWLSVKHGDLREARGRESYGNVLLEGVVFVSAIVAGIAFTAWFFLLSGSSPIPISGG
jgi:uncharacterized membrane protein YbhN (UPF0104 family)